MASDIKIRRISKILRYITILYLFFIPAATAIFWICNGEPIHPILRISILPEGLISDELFNTAVINLLAPSTKILAFLISLIPNLFSVFALFYLAKLFSLFEQLEFFSKNSVGAMRKIGFSLLAGQLTFPVYTALLSLTLTISNPPGQRLIATAFGTAEFSWTAMAVVIILISWIMDEGRKLQEEQAVTI